MSSSQKKYDVFISFRGEDTRETFTSHLYYALKKEKIETYIDYKLQKGDQVWPELVNAIQHSTVSIVVFSENYASSKWCLDELVQILECRKYNGQVVIPVFHRVDASHVRHVKESYERAFAKYEREVRNDESNVVKVLAWKAALKEAANISGWDSSTFSDDFELIENIVRDVWQKLTLMYPKVLKGIQIDENSRHVDSLLKKVSRIGIWGMGGIGKTTIARLMFLKNFAQYDSVCFMEKVEEETEKLGIAQVRNNIFSELLKRQITTSEVLGDTFIKRRLCGRKVFVVLDNVGNSAQLDYLCEELDELGTNSRLIITTRNRHTLRGRVDGIHEVKKWNFEESLNLFIVEAFKQSHPQKGYEGLLERAVAYAGGVPLALKVLGSHFHSRSPKFWKSELDYLKDKRECMDEIQEVLQVSYNGLTKREKEIFLDIAFFYEGENKDFATKILDACGFSATGGIEILVDKALITISNSNRIQIHDLLQKMAFDIVHNGQGKRNRLRDIEEVRDVLKFKKGADVAEGIIFDLSQKLNLYVKADAFNVMVDLRFLRLYVPLGKKRLVTLNHSDQGIMQFSDKLRYFEWNGYPFKCLPDPFCAEFLVEIRLPHSNVEYLWHGKQELVNLEAIDLSECKHLIDLPDLSEASKLRSLYLSGCESLCEIQPSTFSKDTLVTLLLDRCTNLQSLVSDKHLKSLQKVNVYGCSSLKEFSLSSDSIESLDLSNTGVETLHSTIGGMSKLVWLNLEGSKLASLPKEVSCLGLVTELRLSNCDIVTKSNLEGIFDGLESLKILYLKGCGNLVELPTNISSLSSLYELRLDGSSLKTLPSSIKFLSELEILCLDNCRKLHSLPELPLEIKEFRAENCTSLVTVFSLRTFAEKMKGKEKYISFKNGMMMNSNLPSFERTVEDVILTMQSVAFHNILVRQYSLDAHSYNYNSAVVCLPGSKVPSQFKYQTSDSKLTIGYPDIFFALGFIFWVVISPSNRMKNEHGSGVKVQCKCYREDGNRVGIVSEWYTEPITNLNMEHVFVWYDPYHSDSILGIGKENFSFEFFLTNELREHDGVFNIKECGIYPISLSKLPSLLSKINLSGDMKSDLRNAVMKRQPKLSGTDTLCKSQATKAREEYPEMSSSHKKYDVFISFRGEDTRETFTSHLYYALKKEKVETYIDYKLQKEDEVWHELVKAIRHSTVSLVVFSENYASSKWCLDELVEILECRKNHGQVVIPVFYRVDPSNVRHQKESYEKAFAKYEREIRHDESHEVKVWAWKAALKEAASISGWDSTTFRDDSEVIENILRDVWQKLTLMYPKVLKGIQIDENSRHVDSLLKKVSRIGIWGMGGIGKTTIARLMFLKNFAQYDSVCFMEKVKEETEKVGLTQVRNNIFSELLKRQITTSDVLGDTFIKRRLSGRKVFIVLDNVGNAAQIDYLCGELDELGANSRLIITTRDKHTLRGRVDGIHEVKKWNFEESLNLFIVEAFKQSHPQKGYKGLLERAVAYAGGVPLALKVLGSHFQSRSPEFWKSELDYLKDKRECMDEIQEVLQVSYNGLTKRDKETFLDIAFFYEGENKDFATKILDACGFSATSGIEILVDKALITISNSNIIQIHDLLQKMAFDIVHNGQGKRNRLRDIEEVRDVLKFKKGADVAEGMIFDLSQKLNLYVKADAFNMMVDLRFLRLYVPLGKKRLVTLNHSDQGIMQFSDKLRYFEWNGYPFKCLPDPFCAEFLVEIRLPHSNVEYLWHGKQELVNLEAIDLSECKHLINLPDLSEASKLRSLYLSGCESLCEIQPSIFSKDMLVTLLIDRCTTLQSLGSEKHLKSLQKINVYGCSSLKDFSLSSYSIKSLDLSNTGIEILHSKVGGMTKLVWLNLEGLKLTNLPKELSRLGLLTELRLSNCDIVTKSNLKGIFIGLKSLKILYLKGCGNLVELPTNISSLSSLYELRLDGSSLKTLPSSIKFLSELEILCLDNCSKLRSLPELPLEIKEFRAENCTSLVTVSSLKAFAKKMKGKEKYISFKNGMMMNSNLPSFDRTVEDVILTMQSVAFHNILVRQYSLDAHSYNYNSAVVCLPGSKVPSQFKYRTSDSKLSIGYPDIYFSLGFIFWVVISPSSRMKNEHDSGVKIQCKCYREDGNRVGIVSEWYSEPITNLNMEHVFVWYDPYHSDSILGFGKEKFSFEFFLTNDGVFDIKECGICPIVSSQLPSLLSKINLSAFEKSSLCDAVKRQPKLSGLDNEM